MNLHRFRIDHPDIFEEAMSDLDRDILIQAVRFSDSRVNVNILMEYLSKHFQAYMDSVEVPDNQDSLIDERLQKRTEGFDDTFVDFVKDVFS